ncbi:hypothetical protein FQR65_LT04345 [Abscondita terminalis]|nr:hypothetical protein FQR65_LT04345 [Abscondita terminalis]
MASNKVYSPLIVRSIITAVVKDTVTCCESNNSEYELSFSELSENVKPTECDYLRINIKTKCDLIKELYAKIQYLEQKLENANSNDKKRNKSDVRKNAYSEVVKDTNKSKVYNEDRKSKVENAGESDNSQLSEI